MSSSNSQVLNTPDSDDGEGSALNGCYYRAGKVGRPSPYDPLYHPQVARAAIVAFGGTLTGLADMFGVALSTINKWIADYPEFSDAIDEGRSECNDKVENALLCRAMGQKVQETKVFCYEGVTIEHTIDKYLPPDVKACELWLRNRRPHLYRETKNVNVQVDIAEELAAGKQRARLIDEDGNYIDE